MFAARLFLTLAGALVILAVVTYLLVGWEMYHSQIRLYGAEQKADAAWFERLAADEPSRHAALREIRDVLRAVGHRPGAVEAVVVDRQQIVRLADARASVGRRDADPRIRQALAAGRSFAGHDADPRFGDDFNFIVPLRLRWGTWAYEATYSSAGFDRQLATVRTTLMLITAGGVFGVLLLFYLVGGRVLLRSHRFALQRATRDGLTDLPNRRAFDDELDAAVAAAGRHGDPIGLALLDADGFKQINDRAGHQEGDRVLQGIAAVLREHRVSDRAFRIGGDEFALLLPHTDEAGTRLLGRRLSRNFAAAGIAISIGMAHSRGAVSAATLYAEADAALYEAKRHGGDQAIVFEDVKSRVVVMTREGEENLRQLLSEGGMRAVFQPIWDLATMTLLGAEALSRPDRHYGISSPVVAFDLAEKTALTHELDVLCTSRALAAARDLPPEQLLFLNLCPATLDLDAEGDDWLPVLAKEYGIDPGRIVIEVTERFNGYAASVATAMQLLRARGFRVALDDVGTGNSGLEMLRTISPDFVKIDGGIVTAATTEPTARAVLLAIATYAHETGSYVIAESIEDEETLDFIGNLDNRHPQASKIVQGGQGYGLGRPVPILALQALVEGTQPDAAVGDVSPALRAPPTRRVAGPARRARSEPRLA